MLFQHAEAVGKREHVLVDEIIQGLGADDIPAQQQTPLAGVVQSGGEGSLEAAKEVAAVHFVEADQQLRRGVGAALGVVLFQ